MSESSAPPVPPETQITEPAAAVSPGFKVPKFRCFDGYRAIAALAVVGVHVTLISGYSFTHPHTFGRFYPQLDIGVAVFFLISGFLLYWPFVGSNLSGQAAPRLPPYFRRRILRIVPAYWVALTVIAFVLHDTQINSVKQAVIYYGFFQIYFAQYAAHGMSQAWTLCTEMSFYVFVPLWALSLRRFVLRSGWTAERAVRVELAGIAVLYCTGLLARLCIASIAGRSHPQVAVALVWLPAQFDLFALGMGLAVVSAWSTRDAALSRATTSRKVAEAAGRWPWMWWAAAVMCYWLVSTQVNLHIDPTAPLKASQWMWRQILFGLFAFCLLVPGVFGPPERGLIRRMLSNRVMQYLGLISYGIYLWHEAALSEFRKQFHVAPFSGHALPLLVYTVVGSVAAATASYMVVERPSLRFKGRR